MKLWIMIFVTKRVITELNETKQNLKATIQSKQFIWILFRFFVFIYSGFLSGFRVKPLMKWQNFIILNEVWWCSVRRRHLRVDYKIKVKTYVFVPIAKIRTPSLDQKLQYIYFDNKSIFQCFSSYPWSWFFYCKKSIGKTSQSIQFVYVSFPPFFYKMFK